MERRRGGLLRHRNFRLLWTGETISETGDSLANVLVPLLAATVLRASTFDVAALTAAAYLPWLVIGLPAGAWVDRWPRRPLMIACDTVSAAAFASVPVAAWLGVLTFAQLAGVVLVAGLAEVFFATAYQVYLPSVIPDADLVEGNAKLQGSASAALVGGRSAAGALAQAAGAATALALNAVSFLVSALCLLRIDAREDPRDRNRETTVRAEVAEGVRFVVTDPYLRPITVYSIAGNLTYVGYSALAVLFLVRVAGFSPAVTGLLMAVAGVGGVVGSLAARWLSQRIGNARVLLLAAVTSAAGLLIPLARPGYRVIWFVIGAVVLSAGILVGNITVAAFRQMYCPPGLLGRVITAQRFLAWGAIPVGALLAGALGTAIGVRDALWVFLAATALTGAFLCTPALQRNRDLPSRQRDGEIGAGATK